MSAVNESEWSALYETLLPGVYNFFRYSLGDDQLAQDLTSATFERAWKYRHGYRSDYAAFSSWLFSIARNIAIDHTRRERSTVPLEAAAHTADHTTSGVAEHVQQASEVNDMLNSLPERQRELIALKYGGALTNREIAAVTGLSESNVGTILHRTVTELRRQWERQNG